MKFFSQLILPFFLLIMSYNSWAQIPTKILQDITIMEIQSSINPAVLDYLKRGIEKAPENSLILIKMNTPGGLVKTTKDIITTIGDSDHPVAIWITPEGASATSAGAIISSAAHFLFMSNGTNIGAATPIMGTGNLKGDLRKKAIADLVALVKSLALTRGRGATYFAQMIIDAESFNTDEALKFKIIDGKINKFSEIRDYINSRIAPVEIKGEKILFRLSPTASPTHHEMDVGQKLLNFLADPNLAYILFIIGALLLYVELQAPGGFIAGSIGALALILAGIGMQVLPLNWGALGLMGLAFVLFILEIFITSYGLLSLAGLSSLVAGSLFLFRSDEGYVEIQTSVIIGTVVGCGLFLLLIFLFFIKDFKKSKSQHFFDVINAEGVVLKKSDENRYQIKVKGEIWNAQSDSPLNIDDKITVIGQDNTELILKIAKRS